MSKTGAPKWMLDENWGIGTDPYCWVLYKRSGKQWRPRSYHPTAEQLLKSFHRKLTRMEQPDSDLIRHLESLSERAQAAADAFHESLSEQGRVWPPYKVFQSINASAKDVAQ